MGRREKLISSIIGPEMDETKAKMLDATLRLILGDMGEQYVKFWDAEGPGVLCFQPQADRAVFYLTIPELHAAQRASESDGDKDLAETMNTIIEAAQKINPKEKAGYIINDEAGIRYIEIDYNQMSDS